MTRHARRGTLPLVEVPVRASTVVLSAAAVGVVGYAIADWLARAAVYAERVEQDE